VIAVDTNLLSMPTEPTPNGPAAPPNACSR